MSDFTNCIRCGRLIDDAEGALCTTCRMRDHDSFYVWALDEAVDASEMQSHMGLAPHADVPLNDDQQGLLELAEGVAEGVESGDIVLVDEAALDAQRDMLDKAGRFDGLVLANPSRAQLMTATQLALQGKVRLEGGVGYVVVRAVRLDGEGE